MWRTRARTLLRILGIADLLPHPIAYPHRIALRRNKLQAIAILRLDEHFKLLGNSFSKFGALNNYTKFRIQVSGSQVQIVRSREHLLTVDDS